MFLLICMTNIFTLNSSNHSRVTSSPGGGSADCHWWMKDFTLIQRDIRSVLTAPFCTQSPHVQENVSEDKQEVLYVGERRAGHVGLNSTTERFHKKDVSNRRYDNDLHHHEDEEAEDRRACSYSEDKERRQTCDPGTSEDPGQSSESKTQESVREAASSSSFSLGYFTRRLSSAYRDAERRIQGTRDIIRNVGTSEIKVVLSQYVSMMSKELPLISRLHLTLQPSSSVSPQSASEDLPQEGVLARPQISSSSGIPGISGWPEGSLSSLKDGCPQVFHQRLVQLPPSLSALRSLSPEEIGHELESLSPPVRVGQLVSVFWLTVANSRQPVPQPACLLLSTTDITILTSKTTSDHPFTVFNRLSLLEIQTVQVGLAGQHVRLMGSGKGAVLAVFTYSRDLTQELCRSLLKTLCPDSVSGGTEDQPLLWADLMLLSLDWTSSVPDVVLDSRLRVTSRFKRVLADLLYIVHGNMDGPGKPSLADVRPLLYTSVRRVNPSGFHQDGIFQFLLTDTHVALLREDGVFHPVPRGSGAVPAQPQFKGLDVRQRSDVRCLLVKRHEDWLLLDFTFTRKPVDRDKRLRRGSADVPNTFRHHGDSWKLWFGCTAEAAAVLHSMSH